MKQYPYDPNRYPMLCGECGFWLLLDRTCPNEQCPSNVITEVVPVTAIDEAVRRLREEVRRGQDD